MIISSLGGSEWLIKSLNIESFNIESLNIELTYITWMAAEPKQALVYPMLKACSQPQDSIHEHYHKKHTVHWNPTGFIEPA